MRQTSNVLYIAVDSLIPLRGKSFHGLDEFTAALDHEGIPAIWLTSRSRLQFDDARRKHGHTHPFIAEDGCAVYLPEGYFHLRPTPDASRAKQAATVRLGRFTCIPVAEALPAAADAIQTLSKDMGVAVVSLRSLSPRELAQNTGLPQREAELARQRDFDDIFFFCRRLASRNREVSGGRPQAQPAIPPAWRSLVRCHRLKRPALRPRTLQALRPGTPLSCSYSRDCHTGSSRRIIPFLRARYPSYQRQY